MNKSIVLLSLAACLSFFAPHSSQAQVNVPYATVTNDPPVYGPYNGVFLPDGEGLNKKLTENDTVTLANSPWTLYAWVNIDEAVTKPTLVAGLGKPEDEYARYIAIAPGKLVLWGGKDNSLEGPVTLTPGKWHLIAATFDGERFHVYCDGAQVASGLLVLGSVSGVLGMAPSEPLVPGWGHFGGKIAGLTLLRETLAGNVIGEIYSKGGDESLAVYEQGSKPWPVQTRGQAGYRAPQDASQMPRSKAPFSVPVVKPLPPAREALEPDGENQWTVGGWMLAEAPSVQSDGPAISAKAFNTKGWYVATVPGTVLTTLVDRGVYPDPDYGLNNLAIPETLNKQDYWYRTEFKAPSNLGSKRLTLTFHGINYKATVWLNGQSLGTITGAFIRGNFDVTGILKPGQTNVLAVRVSPPPHPGIPQEQSIKGGPGENGGLMCLDGPTFVATEGWDWIPAIRDRDTGIWQPVTITATNTVKIGDPQVVTTLPLPDNTKANVEIGVPLTNATDNPARATLTAAFEGVTVSKDVTLAPGDNIVKLAPAEFAQLTVQNPRLWWPNGYGKPELYHLKLSVTAGRDVSDTKQLRFGIREITYELSLLDGAGHLRRVEYAPAKFPAGAGLPVNVTHDGMREIPPFDPPPPFFPEAWRENWHSWVASLAPDGEKSPAIRMLDDTKAAPYLVVRVNGVRIVCRGGNWGMDDARKRVSRERLEPYFRLNRDAHLDIIRNWVGQSTEETFYDLADEYGMLVWNDFWESTQNYNIEAEDPDLFLKNAADVISRYRNHPSILVWCGRNEGVPQPILNEGLIHLIATLDGTRYYFPSSNQINLQGSGPYSYQDPKLYYTFLNHGFSVETGTPSMSTLESFRAWIPKPDQWPIDDVWAYHDWHASGNGNTKPFMDEIQAEFGAPASLEDFDRKAQMLNYVDHRAIFEGMNAHLWAPNSGRMLWMTQPAWPSTMWQILTSDYDTQASFYGTMKACEPQHIQLDLATYDVELINTTNAPLANVTTTADVFSLDNKSLLHQQAPQNIPADSTTNVFHLDLAPLLANGVALVKLELKSASGETLSRNFYWLAAKSADYRALNTLPAANVTATATFISRENGEARIAVQLKNNGAAAALANKLTLVKAGDGTRILPAYLGDNYISLLPGESREIDIEYPVSAADGAKPELTLRGWNLASQKVSVTGGN
jgi:Exo-beta-D-glucosaminidase Ig-fold domain/Glycosyl hydrolases family 2/Concanavalin A-like lectin/glucanases superfamily/Glycosyl hydrolases family 2, sugar binding domain/Glycosyl hydrolases family 2, TIM barrel domain